MGMPEVSEVVQHREVHWGMQMQSANTMQVAGSCHSSNSHNNSYISLEILTSLKEKLFTFEDDFQHLYSTLKT